MLDRYTFIDHSRALERACGEMRRARALCVDTEFHRESTYYPEFALLQIYDGSRCWIIDPISLPSLEPVWEIIADKRILKVFHAARQDIEIILSTSGGRMPLPLFDTQVAAALLGYGQQIGFGNLVQRILKRNLPKNESFSNWKIRPLSNKQLEYAADDVIWLMPIYQHLRERLKARNRLAWLEEEQASLTDVNTYRIDDRHIFWRVKGSSRLKGKHLAALRELAAWRERKAREQNIPRRRLLADETLIELARRDQLNTDIMMRMRGMSPGLVKRHGEEIILAWKRGIHSDAAKWPEPKAKQQHTPDTDLRLEILDTLVRLKAETSDIAPSILASKEDLSKLASWGHRCRGEPPQVDCLRGWRLKLVGHDLLRLLRGEICLHLDPETGLPVISRLNANKVEPSP